MVAKKLSCQLPIQYPDYKEHTNLTYGDIADEMQSMIEHLVKNNKGKYFDKSEVHDKQIQAQRLKLLNELR